MSYTTEEKIRAIERELKMRRRVYPRQVQAGKMRQEEADYEIAVMEAILEDYRQKVPQTGKLFP